jgi:hypothetical protein
MKGVILKIFVLSGMASVVNAQTNTQADLFKERPVLKTGDSWSYQRTDLSNNQRTGGIAKRTVVDFRKEEVKFDTVGFSGRASTDIYTLNLNFAQTVRAERIERVVFQWPLLEGKKIKHQHPWVNANSEGTNDGECTYQGFEQVKVPAGEFATLKIVCIADWKNTTNNGWGKWENTYWYAPAVKWSVKMKNLLWYGNRLDTQTQDELTEFKVN